MLLSATVLTPMINQVSKYILYWYRREVFMLGVGSTNQRENWGLCPTGVFSMVKIWESHMEKHGYLLPIIINIAEYRLLTLRLVWQCHTIVGLHHEMDSAQRHLFRETKWVPRDVFGGPPVIHLFIHLLLGHGICSELKMQNSRWHHPERVSISKKNDNANKLKSNSKVLKEDTRLASPALAWYFSCPH